MIDWRLVTFFPLANGVAGDYSGRTFFMKTAYLLNVFAALSLVGCSGDHFSSKVHSVAVNSTPRHSYVLLSPTGADAFSAMAKKEGGWLEDSLRAAINHELRQSRRFEPARSGQPDGEVVFDSLRHGLVEVSANNYLVTLTVEFTLTNGHTDARAWSDKRREIENGKTRAWMNGNTRNASREWANAGQAVGHREFTANAGQPRTLAEFEGPRVYEESLNAAIDKVALELVHDL